MPLTHAQLLQIMTYADKRIPAFLPALNAVMPLYSINNPLRMAHFLAQAAHECGEFRYMHELADGSAYEGRKDLGNTEPGDGERFKGRGIFQITGRANYVSAGKILELDLLAHPELLEVPMNAVLSACWFWHSRHLNELADTNDLKAITHRINGGTSEGPPTHLAARREYLRKARIALGVPNEAD